jgi:hypothetical protein
MSGFTCGMLVISTQIYWTKYLGSFSHHVPEKLPSVARSAKQSPLYSTVYWCPKIFSMMTVIKKLPVTCSLCETNIGISLQKTQYEKPKEMKNKHSLHINIKFLIALY